jgi:hypothetical protein
VPPAVHDEESNEEEDSDDDANIEIDIEESVDGAPIDPIPQNDPNPGPRKKRRVSRKVNARIFVDAIEGSSRVLCALGCLSKNEDARKDISGVTTGHISKHVKAKHHLSWSQLKACRKNMDNFKILRDNISKKRIEAEKKVVKTKASQLKFAKLATGNMDAAVRSNLVLISWSVANVIARYSLNCPIFDMYLKSLGSQPAPNRHDLATMYLPQLDSLVVEEIKDSLKDCVSVSLSCDGWRSRSRRDFLNIAANWISQKDGVWSIEVANIDLVYLPGSCTADNLETEVLAAVEDMVLLFIR